MKKRMLMMWAMLLCVCGLVLAACSSSSDAKTEGKAKADDKTEAVEEKVDPTQKFIGTWKLASMTIRGITIVGDFTGITGSKDGMVIEIKADGNGTATFNDDKADLTWELVDDDTLKMNFGEVEETETETEDEADEELDEGAEQDDSEVSSPLDRSIEFKFEDNALVGQYDNDGDMSTLVLTADGSLADEPELDASKAEAITSLDSLVGEWHLTAMMSEGATMYGDAESLATLYGDAAFTTMTVQEDGSATVLGQEANIVFEDGGAMVDYGFYGMSIKALGDKVIINMGESLDMDITLCFSR